MPCNGSAVRRQHVPGGNAFATNFVRVDGTFDTAGRLG
jgi:hypothetical protein